MSKPSEALWPDDEHPDPVYGAIRPCPRPCSSAEMGPVSPRFQGGTLEPVSTGEDSAAWFTGLLSQYPAAYATIDAHLKQVMPDTKDFLNESTGRDSRSSRSRTLHPVLTSSVHHHGATGGDPTQPRGDPALLG